MKYLILWVVAPVVLLAVLLFWAENEFERKPCEAKGGVYSRSICFAPGVVLR